MNMKFAHTTSRLDHDGSVLTFTPLLEAKGGLTYSVTLSKVQTPDIVFMNVASPQGLVHIIQTLLSCNHGAAMYALERDSMLFNQELEL